MSCIGSDHRLEARANQSVGRQLERQFASRHIPDIPLVESSVAYEARPEPTTGHSDELRSGRVGHQSNVSANGMHSELPPKPVTDSQSRSATPAVRALPDDRHQWLSIGLRVCASVADRRGRRVGPVDRRTGPSSPVAARKHWPDVIGSETSCSPSPDDPYIEDPQPNTVLSRPVRSDHWSRHSLGTDCASYGSLVGRSPEDRPLARPSPVVTAADGKPPDRTDRPTLPTTAYYFGQSPTSPAAAVPALLTAHHLPADPIHFRKPNGILG